MKKSGLFLAMIVLVVLFGACAGSPPSNNVTQDRANTEAAQSQPVNRAPVAELDTVMIDWRGASLGGEIPDWVRWAADGDPDNKIPKLERLNGKKTFLIMSSGQNLDLLQAWANIEAQGDVVTRIKTTVRDEGGLKLEGEKNTPGNRSVVEQAISFFSQAELSGLERELDFWVKERSKSSGVESYNFYLVYGITNENFDYQVSRALGQVQAKTQEEKEMLGEIEDTIKQLRISATGE
jgi:hypothetical protein